MFVVCLLLARPTPAQSLVVFIIIVSNCGILPVLVCRWGTDLPPRQYLLGNHQPCSVKWVPQPAHLATLFSNCELFDIMK